MRYTVPGFDQLTLKQKNVNLLSQSGCTLRQRYYLGSELQAESSD